jgi:hypothetical protein
LAVTPDVFFKFPRTPHLWWPLDRPPNDDRVIAPPDARDFLSGDIAIEEKVDGANIGLSVDEGGSIRVQNRGSWIERGAHPQFQPLWSWISQRHQHLTNVLQSERILFGEWCFAIHSVRYDRLPDWFLGFDVYDRAAERFWSSPRRDALFAKAGVHTVPRLYAGRFRLSDLKGILRSEPSRLGTGPMEGIYIRREGSEWLDARAKLVRPEFLDNIGSHWSSRELEPNELMATTLRK